MHLKYTIKNIIRAPLVYIGFFILLTLSIILFITQFSFYMKGKIELRKVQDAYNVIVTLNNTIEAPFERLITPEAKEIITNSGYIKSTTKQLFLAGKLDNMIRLPFMLENDLENTLYMKGEVTDYKESTDKGYILTVLVDEVYYGNANLGSKVKIELANDFNAFDYNSLLNGEPFYFGVSRHFDYNNYDYGSIYKDVPCTIIPTNFHSMVDTPYAELYERYLHDIGTLQTTQYRYPVCFTNSLDTVYNFFNESAYLTFGRMFTIEEYESQSKVCIINKAEFFSLSLF